MKTTPLLERLSSGGISVPGSPLNLLHPVVKLAAPVVLGTGVLASPSLALLSAVYFAAAAAFLAAGAGMKEFFRLTASSLPFLAVIVLLRLFFMPVGTDVAFSPWGFPVTSGTLSAATASALKLLDLVMIINFAGMMTGIGDIVTGVRALLRPFSRLGISPDGAALTVTVLFRFIPLLAAEAERLQKAQAARGADFAERSWNPVRRVSAFLPLLVPLFLSALRRGETMILAMEARGFPGKRAAGAGKTPHFRGRDFVACAVLAAWAVGVVIVR